MKEQSKNVQRETGQGGTKSARMHADNARERTKRHGTSNSGDQGAYETSNKRTGGDRGNKK